MPFADKEDRKRFNREYRKKHKEALDKRYAEWKIKHVEEQKAYFKKYNADRRNKDNPEWVDYQRRYLLLKKYGITIAEYDAMFEQQQGLCDVCHLPEIIRNRKTGVINRLAVDHNHKTGKVRGLLCYKCNRMIIGKNGDKDGAWKIYLSASEYLKRHDESET